MGDISVARVGGRILYPTLTNKLPDSEYAKAKVHMWLFMLNEGKVPKKWLKANSKGTKVDFEMLRTQEEYDKGLNELSVYINEVNTLFNLDFKLNKE